jgi:coiled-coil domain-containing protein 61
MGERVEKSVDLSSRGYPYFVEVQADESGLTMSIEELETGRHWKASYSPEAIESNTKKTGNAKKYSTFVKMLLTVLDSSSETLDFEILTYADIQRLRARQSGTRSQGPGKESQTRYFIINFSGEFDKVHYPLALNYEEVPDPVDLQKTINRMRRELETLKRVAGSGDISVSDVLRENQELKQQVAKLEHYQVVSAGGRKGAVEIDTLIREKKELETENEALQRDSFKEVKRLQAANEDLKVSNQRLQGELSRLKNEMDSIIATLENEGDKRPAAKALEEQLREAEARADKVTKQAANLRQELEELSEEADTLRVSDKKQKLRISQLETELETAMRSKQSSYARDRNAGAGARNTSPGYRATSAPKRSPVVRSPASSRVYTPPGSRGRVDSRGSARSSGSRSSGGSDRGNNRGGTSPSSSLYSRTRVTTSPGSRNAAAPVAKRSPQVARARTSPQMQRQSPQSRRPGNAVSRYSPGSRQYSIKTGGRVRAI